MADDRPAIMVLQAILLELGKIGWAVLKLLWALWGLAVTVAALALIIMLRSGDLGQWLWIWETFGNG